MCTGRAQFEDKKMVKFRRRMLNKVRATDLAQSELYSTWDVGLYSAVQFQIQVIAFISLNLISTRMLYTATE